MLRYAPSIPARYETLGAVLASTQGTLLTASGTANTKGTWVSLGTTGFDYNSLTCHVGQHSAGTDSTCDFGIDDGAGNKWVLVPDVRQCETGTAMRISQLFPVFVPKGALLYARCQSSTASSTLRAYVTGCSAGWGGAPGYGRVVLLSAIATSRGVTVDPGASANTKGAWAVLSASTTARVGALVFGFGGNGTTTLSANNQLLIDVGIGGSGSEQILIPDQQIRNSVTGHEVYPQTLGPFYCDIPAATRLVVRAACSTATTGDRQFDATAYGLVP